MDSEKVSQIQQKVLALKSQRKAISFTNCLGIFLIFLIFIVLYRRMCQKQMKTIGTFEYENKNIYRNVFKS